MVGFSSKAYAGVSVLGVASLGVQGLTPLVQTCVRAVLAAHTAYHCVARLPTVQGLGLGVLLMLHSHDHIAYAGILP